MRSPLSAVTQRALPGLRPLALLTAAAAAAALAVSSLITAPAEERLARAEADYRMARQAQLQLQAAQKTAEELARVWQVLPPRKEFPALVLSISDLARQEEVEIPGMTYALEKAEHGVAAKASMTFQARGEYAAIRRFLHRVETTGRSLFIESLDAARSVDDRQARRAGRSGGPRTVVLFNVRLVTFLRAETAGDRGQT